MENVGATCASCDCFLLAATCFSSPISCVRHLHASLLFSVDDHRKSQWLHLGEMVHHLASLLSCEPPQNLSQLLRPDKANAAEPKLLHNLQLEEGLEVPSIWLLPEHIHEEPPYPRCSSLGAASEEFSLLGGVD